MLALLEPMQMLQDQVRVVALGFVMKAPIVQILTLSHLDVRMAILLTIRIQTTAIQYLSVQGQQLVILSHVHLVDPVKKGKQLNLVLDLVKQVTSVLEGLLALESHVVLSIDFARQEVLVMHR